MAVDLSQEFAAFVEEISIGEPQTSRMAGTAADIIRFLAGKYGLSSDHFFLQGSYPNETAVEPVDGGEYDIDLVAICATAGESADEALGTLQRHFESDGRYRDRVRQKKPCVRLEYAPDDVGKFHVDVVPVRPDASGAAPLEAPRRGEGWHGTAPAEYTQWCQSQGEEFSRTVRILKRWRDEQQTVRNSIKSIVLQVLVSQYLLRTTDEAARVGGTIKALYANLKGHASAPVIPNPVLPSENLATRWTQESFRSFVKELGEAVEFVEKAELASNKIEAADAWREILGEDFPAPSSTNLSLRLGDVSHELDFSEMGWVYAPDPHYNISIQATQQRGKRGQNRKPYRDDGSVIFAGHWLRFKAATRSPGHSEIWWQVTNTGAHAANKSALRGDFLKAKSITNGRSSDPSEHWESTAYTGVHRVRALLVRENRVVAISHYINVNIWSKNWRQAFGL